MKKVKIYFFVRTVLLIKQIGQLLFSGNRNHQMFAILCTARTGSTWLHTLLNSHLNIHSQGEIVRENQESRKLPFESVAYKKPPFFVKAIGLKAFYDLPAYKEALQNILSNESVKIILLSRASKLEQFVSYRLAEKSSKWSRTVPHKHQKIKLNPQEFKEFETRQKTAYEEIKTKLKDHQVYELTYEDLTIQTDKLLFEVQTFLGVKPRKLYSLLEKQGEKDISKQVENWEEIKNEL